MEGGGSVTEHYLLGRCSQFTPDEQSAPHPAEDWETQLAHELFHQQQAAIDALAAEAAAAGWESDE